MNGYIDLIEVSNQPNIRLHICGRVDSIKDFVDVAIYETVHFGLQLTWVTIHKKEFCTLRKSMAFQSQVFLFAVYGDILTHRS